jgi:hypothetical protein
LFVQLKREGVARVAREGGEAAEAQALVLFEQVGDLAEQVERLNRRLGTSSRNGSLPPSSERPGRGEQQGQGQGGAQGLGGDPKPKPERKGSGRKQGAQPGHPGAGRGLIRGA